MPKPNEVFVTVAIPRSLRGLVKRHAKETDLKFKAVVRIALEEYVSNRTAAASVENAQ